MTQTTLEGERWLHFCCDKHHRNFLDIHQTGKATNEDGKEGDSWWLLTWLDILAVLVDVGAAGFSQQDIIPEVVHLHLLKVEDLVLAFLPTKSRSQHPCPYFEFSSGMLCAHYILFLSAHEQ